MICTRCHGQGYTGKGAMWGRCSECDGRGEVEDYINEDEAPEDIFGSLQALEEKIQEGHKVHLRHEGPIFVAELTQSGELMRSVRSTSLAHALDRVSTPEQFVSHYDPDDYTGDEE